MEKISARIAVSEAARQTLVKHLGGDAVLIPNGVTCAEYEDAAAFPGYPREGPTLFFIGRIDEPRKGLQVLLAAMPAIIAAHPGVELLVAGPGDQDEAAEDLLRSGTPPRSLPGTGQRRGQGERVRQRRRVCGAEHRG